MARISLDHVSKKGYSHVARLDTYCRTALGDELYDLIKLRASIVNGCGFCVDMHSTDLERLGVPSRKLFAVSAWQHAGALFDESERSVFAFTDAVTKLGPETVTDDIWDEAAKHFNAEQLGDLLLVISTINIWNRLAIATETTPPVGDEAAAPAEETVASGAESSAD
ncbi:carboxymuconolactone decarboxylase family protein [Brevibacterium sp. RIT 803]|uniref:carboxymuconolactone decarboxylase family protein n=1 Tax=Brevibacterium sp. RIT 803 TaxID=2810210 RepID=UPI00194F92A6|nr:carboxymuconolactone decarboxylase family protein [Brevibacterium sp. RIT 803]MBM6590685.1 carboxymuconolactone decarboxylase family protein [Brevibacterium sp. RIT 803]